METNIETPQADAATAAVITSEELLNHWQGHRRLTRKVIEAFPEDSLFTYSIGGMRPFSALALEMLSMAGTGARGVATGTWSMVDELGHHTMENPPTTKAEILSRWDEATEVINTYWAQIAPERFQEKDMAFGQYEGMVYGFVLYFVDNEIHHRGQGYVYLRSLGIEPPPFWER
jgi:uncharacterized damage-inducible protein DinB